MKVLHMISKIKNIQISPQPYRGNNDKICSESVIERRKIDD